MSESTRAFYSSTWLLAAEKILTSIFRDGRRGIRESGRLVEPKTATGSDAVVDDTKYGMCGDRESWVLAL
jgi:hypothetical protein